MKRFLYCLLLLVSIFCLGCGGASSDSSTEATPKAAAFADKPAMKASAGKTIVVYFSHTKHTEAVAKKIQQETKADIYEIVPEKPYPKEYTPATEVAKQEQQENARPAIKGELPNLTEYDTIMLGYPIWWYNTPMIVNTFLESYDFTGKTIAPFSTSGGAGIEGSVGTIRELARGAVVTDGLLANDANDIIPWLKEQKLIP